MSKSFEYNLSKEILIGELKKDIDNAKKHIEALKGITFNCKKDGKPFANLIKNFNNCYQNDSWFKVYSCSDLYIAITYRGDAITQEIKENNEVYHTDFYGKPIEYLKTVDQIKQTILDEINAKNEYIDAMNQVIESINNSSCEIIEKMLEVKNLYHEIYKRRWDSEKAGNRYTTDYVLWYLLYDFLG